MVPARGEDPEPREVAEPTRGPGEALVRVLAAPVNPVDLAIASGRFYMPVPDPPYVPGAELVGEVVASERLPEGTHVWALTLAGGMGERAAVPEDALVAVPDDLDPLMAGAIGIAGLAGWIAVRGRGELRPGERVLVLGASGVVGQSAVQAAVGGRAGRIVAAARGEDGRRRALALGAHAVVDLGAADLAAAYREAVGAPADLVVDTLWGPPLGAALAVLARGGRVVQVGSSAAAEAAIPAGPLRGGRIDIRGLSVFSEDPVDVADAYHEAAVAAAAGRLRLEVETVALGDGPLAWRRLAAGAAGVKLVLVP